MIYFALQSYEKNPISTTFHTIVMVTLVRPLQPWNAYIPMLLTELGMVTLVRLKQSSYLQVALYQQFAS